MSVARKDSQSVNTYCMTASSYADKSGCLRKAAGSGLYVQCATDHSTFVVMVKAVLINNTHVSTVKQIQTVIGVKLWCLTSSLFSCLSRTESKAYHKLSAYLPPPQDDAISHDFTNKSIYFNIASGTTVTHSYIISKCTHFLLHISFPLSTIELTGTILTCMHALPLVQSCDVRSSCDCRDFPATQGSLGDSPFHPVAHASSAGARSYERCDLRTQTKGQEAFCCNHWVFDGKLLVLLDKKEKK